MFVRLFVILLLVHLNKCSVENPELTEITRIDVTKHPNWKLLDQEICGEPRSSLGDDRIIGGTNATLGAYRWMARIGYIRQRQPAVFKCGGTLISNLYVITAAHCVTNLPSKLKVGSIRLGEYNVETDVDCDGSLCAKPYQDFIPTKIIMHKDYGNPEFKNDIALIRLDRPVSLNSWVVPICLPHGELLERDYVKKSPEVAGWGVYDIEDQLTSVILQVVKLPVLPLENCTKSYKKLAPIDAKQMCVGGTVGFDSCGGDSGGPLMIADQVGMDTPRHYLIGIVSFGPKHCGSTSMPAVYTRLAAYMDWILDNIGA